MTSSARSLQGFLVRILAILDTPPASREAMLLDVEQLLHLATMTVLLKKLPDPARQALNQTIAGKSPQAQAHLIAQQLTHTFSQDGYLAAANQALQEVIPEYLRQLTGSATPEQKQQVDQLVATFL